MIDVALGAMDFGTRVDEATSFRLLDCFVERGGEWIDTANCYSFWADASGVGGQSEEVIGRWLTSRPQLSDRVRISTKVRQQPTTPHVWPESAEGLSAEAIQSAARASLQRLRREHVDLYWAHAEDRGVPLQETVEALAALCADGQVGRLGASNHAVWRVERARHLATDRGLTGFTALQYRHSYLFPRPWAPLPDAGHMLLTPEGLDYATSEDLELWFYTPLLHGSYVRDDRPFPEVYDHPGTTKRLTALDRVARETGRTRNQVVLAWLSALAPHVRPIVGVSTVSQLEEAMDTTDLAIETRHLLDEAI
ncbi:aldo/keto reductase [Kineococcus esterisolvens]|uniref:aldo/keto reductase n=1 Tax=unclassified Kineococcus TaxID=2621656 RepID=UPI003D7DB321